MTKQIEFINISKGAKNFSESMTISQVELIFNRLDINIDKKDIKKIQAEGLMQELENKRYYSYSNVIVIYTAMYLLQFLNKNVVKKNIESLFELDLNELIDFYEYTYNKLKILTFDEAFEFEDEKLKEIFFLIKITKYSLSEI